MSDLNHELIDEVENEIHKQEKILKKNWLKYLDFNYIPKNPKHREEEIKKISVRLVGNIIQKSTGNILIYGNPGTGKTMSFRIAKDIAEIVLAKKNIEDYKIVYVVATSTNFSKILADICRSLGVNTPVRGLSVREYLGRIGDVAKGRYIHVCIDEFDKLLEDPRRKHYAEDIIYYFTRTDNLSATLITNKIDLAKSITDARVLSSLDTINTIFFNPYTKDQCRDILVERINLAFKEGVFTKEAIDTLAEHVAESGGDLRNGLSILKFCGNYAMEKGLSKIDEKIIRNLIWKHDIQKDGEALIGTLSFADKLIVAAIYSLLLENKSDQVYSGDVFARQDYFRLLLGKPGISRDSFSVYLTRLSTNGIIGVKKVWEHKYQGSKSYIFLRYSRDAIRYMLENDSQLDPLIKHIFPHRSS